jgi:hypothetical protein
MRRPLPLLAFLAVLAAGTCSAATNPPNVVVTPAAADLAGGSLAVDPTLPSRLAVAYATGRSAATGSCVVARSRDGGRTWESQVVAGSPARPLPPGATHCADAVVAFGPEGTVYVAYDMSRLGGSGQVYVTSSTDHGTTFRSPVALATAPAGGGDFEPAIAAGPSRGTVSVAFERYSGDFDSAVVLAASSGDGGRTFSTPVAVSPAGQNAVNGRAVAAADRGGKLYVGWVDASDVDFDGAGDARIEVAVSGDGGRSFRAPATVATVPSGCGPNDDCGNRFPQIALAAGADGVIDLAWSSAAYPDAARISVARSVDAGRRWSAPKRLAVPAGRADHDQLAPSLAIARDGRVDLGFGDQARDADDGLLDVYLAYSIDGARTFSTPARLDAIPSNTRRAAFTASVAVAATDGAAHAAWQDARADVQTASGVVFARVPDAHPPRLPVVDGPRVLDRGRVTYSLRSSDDFTPRGALRFRCAFDGAPLHTCGMRYTQALKPGRHVFRVRALDAAGNPSPVRSVAVLVGRR